MASASAVPSLSAVAYLTISSYWRRIRSQSIGLDSTSCSTTLPPLARSGVPAARRLAEEGRDGRDARRRLGGWAGALARAVPGAARAQGAAALGALLPQGPDPAGRAQERRADGGAGR